MPWNRSQPTDPKYRSPEHRRERKRWADIMATQGYLMCAQPECVASTRVITPDQGWHLGHDDTGTYYIGPTHARCNVRDGAQRGRSRQTGSSSPGRWVL